MKPKYHFTITTIQLFNVIVIYFTNKINNYYVHARFRASLAQSKHSGDEGSTMTHDGVAVYGEVMLSFEPVFG